MVSLIHYFGWRACIVGHNTPMGHQKGHAKICGKIFVVVGTEKRFAHEGLEPTHMGQGRHSCSISSRFGDLLCL